MGAKHVPISLKIEIVHLDTRPSAKMAENEAEPDVMLDEYIIKSYQDASIIHELEERVSELEACISELEVCNNMLLAELDNAEYRTDPRHEMEPPLKQYLRSYKLVEKCPVTERPALDSPLRADE